jgi:hypothetical protein
MSTVEYRLLPPGSYDPETLDFRDDYAIVRVESTVVDTFGSREAAREFMLATTDERRARDGAT